jgi:hypothetical protein
VAQQQGGPEGRRDRLVVSGMVGPAAASEHFWHKLLVAGGCFSQVRGEGVTVEGV